MGQQIPDRCVLVLHAAAGEHFQAVVGVGDVGHPGGMDIGQRAVNTNDRNVISVPCVSA